MKKFLIGALAVLGLLSILLVFLGVGLAVLAQMGKPTVPSRTILEIDFEDGLVEGEATDDPLERLFQEEVPTIRDTVEALERASSDRRVKALVARVGAAPMSMSAIQEVRDAVLAFRDSGKPAVAFAETFGEFSPGNGAYYLATAFDRIYLQPSGDVGLTGLQYESPFVKGTLDKLGIVPSMDQRHEYKNAMNLYTEKRFTPAHREAMQRILESRFSQIVQGVARARGMSEDQVRERIDHGPYYGAEAVEANLVDALAYRDEVLELVEEEAGGSARRLYLSHYLSRAGRPHRRGETIALIYGVGAVARGPGGYDPLTGDSVMGSDTVATAFRQAIRDRRVRAILFRVDSPGGSYVASDTIWRETILAREAGKPVVVSMGNLAGSGGYYVAMSADRIVAQPSTITGSIGVLGGKLVTREMWSKIGMTFDEVHSSHNAGIWSTLQDYNERERERFRAGLDRIYEDFTAKVAEARGLAPETVARIARGRIWTGEDALEIGLVDELGGFRAALRLAKEAAGIDADAPVRLRVLPRKRGVLERLFGEKPDHSGRAGLARVAAAVRPLVRLAHRLGLAPPRGVLTMPEAEAFR